MKTVTRERLEFLIATVEHELARVDERCGEQPRYGQEGYSFGARDAWWKTRDIEIGESKRRLAAEGARFTCRAPDGPAIHLAGIRSSSTSSFTGAFHNWLNAARKRIERGAA